MERLRAGLSFLFSSSAVPVVEAELCFTALCVFEPDISSNNPLLSSFVSSIKNILSTPALHPSLTDWCDNVASLAREKLHSTPPPLFQPPTPFHQENNPTEKITKCATVTPLFLLKTYWPVKGEEQKKASAHLRQGPTVAGKGEVISSSIRTENQKQQVVTPEIPPPLSRTPASLLGFSHCFALIQAAVAAVD